jgi:hypothetical protein
MIRRLLVVSLLALLTAVRLPAQRLQSLEPPNPKPGDKVMITVAGIPDCPGGLGGIEVTPPTAGRNGLIRVPVEISCACVTPPLRAQSVETGPLDFGTYDVKLYQEYRFGDELCSPPSLIGERALTVSRNGAVVTLAPDPPHPAVGQPVTVGFSAFCPFVLKGVSLEPAGTETLIVMDVDPKGPGIPCQGTPSSPVGSLVGPLPAGTYRLQVKMGSGPPPIVAEALFAVGPLEPALTLRNGRFRVWAEWRAPGFGEGSAQGMALTTESGYLTFFSPTNVEVMVKVLDACKANHHYWVYAAGMTDVGVSLHVEDMLAQRVVNYSNVAGRAFQPVLDIDAFATCP